MNSQVKPIPQVSLRYHKAMDAYRYRLQVKRLAAKHQRRLERYLTQPLG